MVVVAVVLGMLAFGKTGYAKSIQNAILGSADHIVETGENITKKEAGDILEIEGKEYIVVQEKEKDKVLVMNTKNARTGAFYRGAFDNKVRPDGQFSNTYENSDADKYLENTWYNNLSSTMKAAIQTTSIKQVSYDNNTISRHVFLPSAEEIKMIVDTENLEKVKAFLHNNSNGAWTRDSTKDNPQYAVCLEFRDYGSNHWSDITADSAHYNSPYLYPTFVIDLSKVDYTEAGHTDYK